MTGATRAALDIDRARSVVLRTIRPVEQEQAGIINSFGRTLAETVVVESDVPPCCAAAKDGYAAISADTLGASPKDPRRLSVLAESTATCRTLQPGTVVPVRMGDPLPEGADSIIDFSDAFRPQNGPEVLVMAEAKPSQNVFPAGSLLPNGEPIIDEGIVISDHEMSLLAALGRHGVAVRRRVKVAIVTTGSGVVDIVADLNPGESRNSARYQLVGMVLESGCDLGRLIHIKEGRIALQKALAECGGCDAVIVALGPHYKHDIAVSALKNVGTLHFERTHMKPGSALAFASVEKRPVFVLPGTCVLECFEALIRPALLSKAGRTNLDRLTVRASVQSTLKLNPGYTHYIRAITEFGENGYVTLPTTTRSPELAHWTRPNSLIAIPPNVEVVKRGEMVEVLVLSK